MFVRHYRPLLGLAASISLLLLAACGSDPGAGVDPVTGAAPTQPAARTAAAAQDDTDETIFTVLGLAKRESRRNIGPITGTGVSPELWEAAHDALKFAGISSEDPMTGLLVTKWYSPPENPSERLRVTVFITARALRSDSLAVSIQRQVNTNGQWQDAPVDRNVVSGLDNDILLRARHIHAERYRANM
jgi:Domain of unknown function (DUF3576)